jgi:hypothetical protein
LTTATRNALPPLPTPPTHPPVLSFPPHVPPPPVPRGAIASPLDAAEPPPPPLPAAPAPASAAAPGFSEAEPSQDSGSPCEEAQESLGRKRHRRRRHRSQSQAPAPSPAGPRSHSKGSVEERRRKDQHKHRHSHRSTSRDGSPGTGNGKDRKHSHGHCGGREVSPSSAPATAMGKDTSHHAAHDGSRDPCQSRCGRRLTLSLPPPSHPCHLCAAVTAPIHFVANPSPLLCDFPLCPHLRIRSGLRSRSRSRSRLPSPQGCRPRQPWWQPQQGTPPPEAGRRLLLPSGRRGAGPWGPPATRVQTRPPTHDRQPCGTPAPQPGPGDCPGRVIRGRSGPQRHPGRAGCRGVGGCSK